MKVLKNKQKGHTVSLEVEISLDILNEAFDLTFKRISKSAKVPGFRQGKVPRNVFEKHYGKGLIIQEGLSDAVNIAYGKAIRELELDVVDYPKNVDIGDYKENTPVRFSCDVDVRPEVKLGKYKGVKLVKEAETAADNAVTEQLDKIRENFAEYKEADTPATKDDIVTANIQATIDGEAYAQWTKDAMGIKLGLKNFGDEFDAELDGVKAGDSKSFSVSYADDFPNKSVAGKAVAFELSIVDVRKKSLPELDDSFAEKVTNGTIKTIEELKKDLSDKLNEQAQNQSGEKLRSDAIEAVVEDSKMDIPNGMIESEIDYDLRQYENQMRQSGGTLEQYLSLIGQTMDQFREQLREGAKKRVQSDLVLSAIIDKEKLDVTDEQLKAEVTKILPSADTDEKIEAELKKINVDGFKRMILQRQAIDFIIDKAKVSDKK